MRHAYLAQDRADLIEAIKCLARGMSEIRNRSHDTVETCVKIRKRSVKESTTVLHTRKKHSTFGSPCGQRLGRRHCNASKHDWSDSDTWTTFVSDTA